MTTNKVADSSAVTAMFNALDVKGIVCAGGVNFTYLSDVAFPGTLARHLDLTASARDAFVIWAADGQTAAVVSEIAEPYMKRFSAVDRLFVYRDYRQSPGEALTSAMRELGLADGRVGFDTEWFGTERWREFESSMPNLDSVPCGPRLDRIRAIKTDEELRRLKRATQVLDQAFHDVFTELRPGMSEKYIHSAIIGRATELGAGLIHGMLQASSNPVLYGGESETKIAPGDLIRTDYVAYVDGYAANLSRPIYIGEPDQTTLERYQAYLEVYWRAADLLTDGRTGGEVHSKVQSLLAGAGFDHGLPLCGHGIGSWWHQQYPMLVDESDDVLEAGMVLALEPIGGYWHLQDHFLVGQDGSTRMSDTFDISELTVVS